MWEIEFYEKSNGHCPAREFLNSLSPKDDLPFVERKLGLLSQYGYAIKRPHTDYLRDDIWELRVKTRRGQTRLFYFYFLEKKIIITHGIIKKTNKVPDAEIDRAIEYRTDHFARNKGIK